MLKTLVQAVRKGYKIICSCPTCGYFYKKLLLENAYFSEAAQAHLQSQTNEMKVPLGSAAGKFLSLPKTIYQKILKDEGYFSSINPIDRIELSKAVCDLGEFLLAYQQAHHLTFKTNDPQIPLIYFAPLPPTGTGNRSTILQDFFNHPGNRYDSGGWGFRLLRYGRSFGV